MSTTVCCCIESEHHTAAKLDSLVSNRGSTNAPCNHAATDHEQMFVYLRIFLSFITKHLSFISSFLFAVMKSNNNNNSYKKTRSSARAASNACDDKTATKPSNGDGSKPETSDQSQVIITGDNTSLIVRPLTIHCLSSVEELRSRYPELQIMGMAPKKK